MKQQRIVIYPTDVTVLTGKGIKYSRKLLTDLKVALGKDAKQHITCCELGAHLNLDPEVIYRTINKLPLLAD